MLVSSGKEWTTDTDSKRAESQNNFPEWKKLGKKYILYDFVYNIIQYNNEYNINYIWYIIYILFNIYYVLKDMWNIYVSNEAQW